MNRYSPAILPRKRATSDRRGNVVRMFNKTRDRGYHLLFGQPRPGAEDGIVGAIRAAQSWDVRFVRPLEKGLSRFLWPENAYDMVDVTEVDIAEHLAAQLGLPEVLGRSVRETANEEENDVLRSKLRDAADMLGESITDDGVVLENHKVTDLTGYVVKTRLIPTPGGTLVTLRGKVGDHLRISWEE